ncbi:hypothetical protein [Pseudosulfitobacter pseudonitzschiae]|uniref:hypothetical protein n=1 Tax=Pseudosulfitobacter pseudonitzschiae TaxID=1402135 RepID=UPI001AF8C3B7|nr:hypothetical protein [Pseudosulfitobacter pseudonitzschiae]MBM1814908.1 hypothetical protein [Pseudosulfitobacter pseudonitzschiae]MBM1831902.1 hypothetical protein [Pseudosulfitobacter pseudonitzschiae]MBM1836767.1 hypothetical protein [Pseudosulfitobacter pseudonitzschiae]MBM1841614.1 hypothetical protein [Pseudosulfitobacter pseudonitzschiae]MBM1846481.1 hypothetical protein [Pseudosulfitobacter pseudonitzschiae]
MTEERRGFSVQELLKLVGLIGTVVAMLFGGMTWAFLKWSEWREVPSRLLAVETRLAALPDKLSPNILDFKGIGLVTQKQIHRGGTLTVVYVVRRSIDCETTVRVQFFDHDKNLTVYAYDMPAVRAPVSSGFSSFAARVRIPSDLPPGTYSYWPVIIPSACGVYGPTTPPMSEAFEVAL